MPTGWRCFARSIRTPLKLKDDKIVFEKKSGEKQAEEQAEEQPKAEVQE